MSAQHSGMGAGRKRGRMHEDGAPVCAACPTPPAPPPPCRRLRQSRSRGAPQPVRHGAGPGIARPALRTRRSFAAWKGAGFAPSRARPG